MKKLLEDYFIFLLTIFLAVVTPALVFFVSSRDFSTFRDVVDAELRTRLYSTVNAFSTGVVFSLDNIPQLQAQVDKFKELPEVTKVSVLLPKDSKFAVIASSDKDSVQEVLSESDWTKAWEDGEVQLGYENFLAEGDLNGKIRQTNNRVIKTAYPVKNHDGVKLALVVVDFSPDKTDALVGGLERGKNIRNIALGIFILVPITVFGCILDYRNKLSIKLIEALQSKDDLLAVASHEIAGPLTNIKGSLAVIMEEAGPQLPESSRKLLERAALSTEELIDLVEDLLVVFRFERGKVELYPRPAHLEEIAVHVADIYQQAALEKGLTLSYERPKQALPKLIFDPEKVREVLTNFVGNAIKYTEKGAITISHEIRDGMVYTYVKDTGPGIEKGDVPKLFQRFSRLTARSHAVKGTGLGLYISRLIIEHHKGSVNVESTVGQGSTFSFSLPIPKKVL